jgi:Diadenosine tetraphosphate (Ap4A) hydrolase and other HIT family hydrolases
MKNIFEKIIDNEIPAYKVYEDSEVIAILDINPISYGHTLLIPKKRIENFVDSTEDMSHILKILKELSLRLKEKLEADGITIITNNYYGQEIKHLHFHIIPRYEGDKFDDLFNHKEMDLEKVYRQIM